MRHVMTTRLVIIVGLVLVGACALFAALQNSKPLFGDGSKALPI